LTTVKGQEKVETIPMKAGAYDYAALNQRLVEIKKTHPEVFKIELSPDGAVPYNDIVKIMDEARQARDSAVRFPVLDAKTGKQVETQYMFPEVVFVNMMEG